MSDHVEQSPQNPQPEIVNSNEVMVGALQRSGHHAFIVWFLNNIPKHAFANCVIDHRIYRPKHIKRAPEKRLVSDMDLNLEDEFARRWREKNLFIYNTENLSTEEALAIFDDRRVPRRIGRSKTRTYVAWLRDPFNNLASLYRRAANAMRNGKDEEAVTKLLESRALWIDHFRAFIDKASEREEILPVLYNQWLDDMEFREEILGFFGATNEYDVEENVPWGMGSSFYDYSENQKASEKADLEARYRHFEDDEQFWALFRDDEFLTEIDRFLEIYASNEMQRARELIEARV